VSYYDAAYVSAARDRKCELVTDDARLARVASKFLKVIKSTELPSIISGESRSSGELPEESTVERESQSEKNE
jgi:hypothetical protein